MTVTSNARLNDVDLDAVGTLVLHRAGVDIVHVDDAFTRAGELGLTVGGNGHGPR